MTINYIDKMAETAGAQEPRVDQNIDSFKSVYIFTDNRIG